MTTDRQRRAIVDYLQSIYGGRFEVAADGDDFHVAFPIWTPPGKHTVGRYRYASASAQRRMDGRKPTTESDLCAVREQIESGFARGARDVRFTEQARSDYRLALAVMRAGAGHD